MQFQFVDDNTTRDRSSRKAIRSHVMKGRNQGKKLQRGRRHAPPPPIFDGLPDARESQDVLARRELLFPEIIEKEQRKELKKRSVPANILAGSEYEYFSFPVQFTPSMRYLVYQFHSAVSDIVYPHEFCRPSNDGKHPWFGYLVTDQAFLHCLLAMTVSFISLFRKPDSESLEATRHFSQAIRLLNRDLSQSEVPPDSTIAVVSALSLHSNLLGDVEKSKVHFEGLKRVLDLRPGGLLGMRKTNLHLVQKICRTDIDLAVLDGKATLFGALSDATSELVASLLSQVSIGALPSPLEKLCAPLQSITRDVLAFCRLPGNAKLEALQYQDMLISMCQRLLDFAPLKGRRPPTLLDDVWQLGLLTFLSTIKYPTGALRNNFCRRLNPMLRDRLEVFSGIEHRYLRFWLLFMEGLAVPEDEDRWYLGELRDLADRFGLDEWEDAQKCLEAFPWIRIVHDAPGRLLWKGVCRRKSEPLSD